MNPYDYKKENFLAWLEKRMGKYGYTVENAPDSYSKAYKSGDPKDLPVLITQEWWDYLNPERWKNKNTKIKVHVFGNFKSCTLVPKYFKFF